MKEHSVKLYSRVSLVAMSIDIAHGIPFDQEKFNDMLQQLIYKEPWILNWFERQAHEWKYSKYEDEEDLSDDLSDDCPDGSSVLETGSKIAGKPKKVSKKDKVEKKKKKSSKEGTKAKNKAARGCKLNTNQWGKA